MWDLCVVTWFGLCAFGQIKRDAVEQAEYDEAVERGQT